MGCCSSRPSKEYRPIGAGSEISISKPSPVPASFLGSSSALNEATNPSSNRSSTSESAALLGGSSQRAPPPHPANPPPAAPLDQQKSYQQQGYQQSYQNQQSYSPSAAPRSLAPSGGGGGGGVSGAPNLIAELQNAQKRRTQGPAPSQIEQINQRPASSPAVGQLIYQQPTVPAPAQPRQLVTQPQLQPPQPPARQPSPQAQQEASLATTPPLPTSALNAADVSTKSAVASLAAAPAPAKVAPLSEAEFEKYKALMEAAERERQEKVKNSANANKTTSHKNKEDDDDRSERSERSTDERSARSTSSEKSSKQDKGSILSSWNPFKNNSSSKLSEGSEISIGGPSGFRHEQHIGWNPETGFDLRNLPPQWKNLFDKAGVTEAELKDKKTALFIVNFVAASLGGKTIASASKTPSNRNVGSQVQKTADIKQSVDVATPQAIQAPTEDSLNLAKSLGDAPPIRAAPRPPPSLPSVDIQQSQLAEPEPEAPTSTNNNVIPEIHTTAAVETAAPATPSPGLERMPPPPPAKSVPPPPAQGPAPTTSNNNTNTASAGSSDLLASIRARGGGGLKHTVTQAPELGHLNEQEQDSLAGALARALGARRQFLTEGGDDNNEDDNGEWD